MENRFASGGASSDDEVMLTVLRLAASFSSWFLWLHFFLLLAGIFRELAPWLSLVLILLMTFGVLAKFLQSIAALVDMTVAYIKLGILKKYKGKYFWDLYGKFKLTIFVLALAVVLWLIHTGYAQERVYG